MILKIDSTKIAKNNKKLHNEVEVYYLGLGFIFFLNI